MSNKKISQDNPNAWRNPWVLGWLALVAVVLVVNAVMITIAFVTNPGLVTEDYYEKGQSEPDVCVIIESSVSYIGFE